jgi:hypothetical protein
MLRHRPLSLSYGIMLRLNYRFLLRREDEQSEAEKGAEKSFFCAVGTTACACGLAAAAVNWKR